MRFNFQQIVSYCLALGTQNPGLREVDLETGPKRGSDKMTCWNKEEKPQKKTSCIVQPGLTYWIPALREADLEPSAKRGTNRTKALANLYWLSRSLHPKELPNQISHKSTKVDPIRLSRTCKKCDQISKFYVLQHIKRNSPKTTRSTGANDWVYKWGLHTKR